NGMLYSVTNNAGAGRLYTVNTATGVATQVGTTPFTLTGAAFGVDFNPVPDLLRITSDTGENLRINPGTAAVAGTDTALAYAATDPANGTAPVVVGSAYTNNFAGATSTKLYDIDANLDRVVLQGAATPNDGQLFTRGGLGFDTTDQVGFDIT